MVLARRPLFTSGSRIFGAWTSLGHPSITEIFAYINLDFIGIDLEHSTISQDQSQRIIAASHAGGIACLPRVASHNGEQIKRLLDSGADGIIVPMVSTRAQVEQIVEWCKYPPLGKRSYGIARAQGYGFDFENYTSSWNDSSGIIIQIESIQGVEVVADLLSYDGVNGAMVGPYDLSGSLGIPGHLSDPRVTEACSRVLQACRRAGKACGTHITDPAEQDTRKAFESGYSFVVLASDVFILWKWSERMRSLVDSIRREKRS